MFIYNISTALQVMTPKKPKQPRQLRSQKRRGVFQNLADAALMALYLYKMPIPLFSIPALSIAHSYAVIMAVYMCSEWHTFAHRANRTGKTVLQSLQAFQTAQNCTADLVNVCCRSYTLSCAIGGTCSLDHIPEDCSLYLPAASAFFKSDMSVSELFCTLCCPVHSAQRPLLLTLTYRKRKRSWVSQRQPCCLVSDLHLTTKD